MSAELMKQGQDGDGIPEDSRFPDHITVSNVPEQIAKLNRRAQMIVVALSAGMSITDIATLCNCTTQNIDRIIAEQGIRKWVSCITPEMVKEFRRTRWLQTEQQMLTLAQTKASSMSAAQALMGGAVAATKLSELESQLNQAGDGRDPGELIVSIKARLHR